MVAGTQVALVIKELNYLTWEQELLTLQLKTMYKWRQVSLDLISFCFRKY